MPSTTPTQRKILSFADQAGGKASGLMVRKILFGHASDVEVSRLQ